MDSRLPHHKIRKAVRSDGAGVEVAGEIQKGFDNGWTDRVFAIADRHLADMARLEEVCQYVLADGEVRIWLEGGNSVFEVLERGPEPWQGAAWAGGTSAFRSPEFSKHSGTPFLLKFARARFGWHGLMACSSRTGTFF